MSSTKPILCIDFDGVVHSYTSGWHGATIIPDPPVPGALEWLQGAQELFDVCIYSSRSKHPGGIEAMQEWFEFHSALLGYAKVAFMEKLTFSAEKPAAFLTIDDRAICFQGWDKLDARDLLNFKPWNKR
jgi:hypothetical protein